MEFPDRKPHCCSFCTFKCKQKSGLETHMRQHTRERPCICDKCKREYSSKTSLVAHLQHVHQIPAGVLETKYNCSLCAHATNNKYSLRRHIIQKHTEERSFPCQHPNCEYAAKSSQALKKHNIARHSSDRKYLCQFPNCSYQGKTKKDMSQHFVSHSEDRPFSCDFQGCNYRAKRKGALKGHKLSIHLGGYKPFACSNCSHTTTTKTFLRAHELKHSQEKPIKCDISGCEFACKTKSGLSQHDLRCHTEKTFKCDFVGYSSAAASPLILELHKKAVHFEKAYKCPNCDFRAARLCQLKEHQVRHKTRKLFPCPNKACTFRSMNRDSLRCHVRAHNANLGCLVKGCSFVGRSSSSLKRHVQIHNPASRPFHCALCPKKFSMNGYLSQHLKTHTAEKPVKCPACHYASKVRWNVMRHVRTFHSTAFPEFGLDAKSTCDHCHVNFGCVIGLAMHKLKLKTAVVVLTRLQLKLGP